MRDPPGGRSEMRYSENEIYFTAESTITWPLDPLIQQPPRISLSSLSHGTRPLINQAAAPSELHEPSNCTVLPSNTPFVDSHGLQTDSGGYRELPKPGRACAPTLSSKSHSRAPPPDPRLTGARVRRFRGCNLRPCATKNKGQQRPYLVQHPFQHC